ncbi:MAG: TfoX/Sxy family protein [Candidatus Manganitrophaceae bacterium]
MSEDRGFAEHVKDLLDAAIGSVRVRPMFGGYGIYYEETMFALIAWGKLYFKADDQSKRHFEEKGLTPFVYDHAGKKPMVMSYWEAPPETLDDPEEIKPWAMLGVEAALRAKRSKKPAKKKRRG